MYITHVNSLCTKTTTLIDSIPYPQYIHQVSDGGMRVSLGAKILPSEFVEYMLRGSQGATTASRESIGTTTAVGGRNGLILATGGSVWTGYGTTTPLTDNYPKHKILPLGMTQIYAGQLANRIGKFQYVSTDSTACISAHAALYQARNLIASDVLDRVVVVSTDNGASEEYMHFFGENGLCALQDDTSNTKFRLGQGANITILESEESIEVTGNKPLAKLHDISIVSEQHSNPLGIASTGEGYRRVLTNVLTPDMLSKVNYVKTHSTFSEDNNIEHKVITEMLGDVRQENYKKKIGHTMGSSTAVEMHLAMRNYRGTFISLGAGMGNVFSAAVVETLSAFREE